ncbi:Acg family FMN-binding oxidoreductase [Lentzea sp. NEAU-D7]|uniref:Acg family FMN-binding oxidoreductase n=1 Tax=Lentzea sp. NEAU-D7 TaxID=2994667 RepID=UPI00224A91BD|nr:nitroreductase family protein [Lentzea sp. NEAU-D7]MCX2951437.1 nitroreductase family protein [Lentzea sp. NEAU-D7]
MAEVPEALGLAPEAVQRVLEAASLAPSVHNAQPWRFRVLPDRIELHPDPRRRLPATDPDDRELRLSCGAALFNLRLALQGEGVRPLVSMLPGQDAPGALAIVRRGGTIEPDDEQRALLKAVPRRRTNRRPFHEARVDPRQCHALVRAAELERSWLHVVVTPQDRAQLKKFVKQAHEIQLRDEAVQAELASFTGHRPGSTDGIPAASAGVRPELQDEWVFRDFQGPERLPGKDYESDPLVVVLCSFYDGPLGDLQAGQAMQRVLLAATVHGLSASFLSQPVEVHSVREQLRRSLGGVLVPQTVLRLGYSTPVAATPRRPLSELLLEPDDCRS